MPKLGPNHRNPLRVALPSPKPPCLLVQYSETQKLRSRICDSSHKIPMPERMRQEGARKATIYESPLPELEKCVRIHIPSQLKSPSTRNPHWLPERVRFAWLKTMLSRPKSRAPWLGGYGLEHWKQPETHGRTLFTWCPFTVSAPPYYTRGASPPPRSSKNFLACWAHNAFSVRLRIFISFRLKNADNLSGTIARH